MPYESFTEFTQDMGAAVIETATVAAPFIGILLAVFGPLILSNRMK